LHREVNRLFDGVYCGFDLPSSFANLPSAAASWPNVEISAGERELRVTAEVPGLDEKDLELYVDDGVLTTRGEKRAESEDKERRFSERFYGRFERRIAIGSEVQEDKVNASFKNGVLTITLPKTELSKGKRIAINGSNR
jgi:HSP20 family protein